MRKVLLVLAAAGLSLGASPLNEPPAPAQVKKIVVLCYGIGTFEGDKLVKLQLEKNCAVALRDSPPHQDFDAESNEDDLEAMAPQEPPETLSIT